MAYRSLLSVIYDDAHDNAQIAAAAMLARRFDAHLELLCLGIDEMQVGYYFAAADAVLHQTSIAMAREKAQTLLERCKAAMAAEDIRWSAQAVVAQMGGLNEVVGQAALFSDLVVQPMPLTQGSGPVGVAVTEAALFSARAPVLLLPESGLPQGFPRRAVIGWNGGVEAVNAVRAALPALQLAGTASVAMVDPPVRPGAQSSPGQSLAAMLDRHGVKADISLLPKTRTRISEVLLQHAKDQDADLFVAGAYGHSRFREAILGGVTREMMAHADIALLMAH